MLTCNTELCHKCCLYFRECSTSQCIINTLRALWWKKQNWQRVYKQQSSASKNTSASNHSWPQVWAEVSLVSLFWVPLFKTQLYNLPQKQWNVVFHHQTRCMNALNTTVMKKACTCCSVEWPGSINHTADHLLLSTGQTAYCTHVCVAVTAVTL